ncbi:hypothetical protein SBRCBS47491_009295 [Sporothrix bragantina]|uniref:Uncharacterized protein n=1 Tax=Sporothrix bragantina TaxID=671064 RepID=A0ABP0CUG6_9PEZI
MYVISPMSNCASVPACDRRTWELELYLELYLERNRKLALPLALALTDDTQRYEDLPALTETHRESAEYKAMRAAAAAEALLDRPSDLRFLQPTGTGFMNRKAPAHNSRTPESEYVVIDELKPKPAADGGNDKAPRDQLLAALKQIADDIEKSPLHDEVLTFWVLEYRPEYNDEALLVFARFVSKQAYESAFKRSDVVQDAE